MLSCVTVSASRLSVHRSWVQLPAILLSRSNSVKVVYRCASITKQYNLVLAQKAGKITRKVTMSLVWVYNCDVWAHCLAPRVSLAPILISNMGLHLPVKIAATHTIHTPDRSTNPAQHHRQPIISCDCRTCKEQPSYQHHSINLFAIFQETS